LKRTTIPQKQLLQLADTIQDLAAAHQTAFQAALLNSGSQAFQRGAVILARSCAEEVAECQAVLATCQFQGSPEAAVVAALEAFVEVSLLIVPQKWMAQAAQLSASIERLRAAVDAVPVRPLHEATEYPEPQPTQNKMGMKRPTVLLGGPQDSPTVNGKTKDPLTPAKYVVVRALMEAGEAGLSMDELKRRSGKQDAVKHLRDLRDQDGAWKQAIIMAGQPWDRYRIRHV
jgi:hypothetical protein